MTPREVQQKIDHIDHRLRELEPRQKTLATARQRWMLAESEDASWAIRIIDHGLRRGEGRPNDSDLAILDHGGIGLVATERELGELREPRQLLERQRPAAADIAAANREAKAQADAIDLRAQRLDEMASALRRCLGDLARLALEVADETREIWEANQALDSFCVNANIDRPETTRRDALTISMAPALSVLLAHYFCGGQPSAVDANLRAAMADEPTDTEVSHARAS